MTSKQAPFRVDHVGSFLRPKDLVEARAKFANGEITREELTAVEDKNDSRNRSKTNCCWIKRRYRRRIPPRLLAP